MDSDHAHSTETFLLTTASRVRSIHGALVVVAELNGQFLVHTPPMEAIDAAKLVGTLEAIKLRILNQHLVWQDHSAAGEPLEEP